MTPTTLTAADVRYPVRLGERLADAAPLKLAVLGNLDILASPKTAFFCSAHSPGHTILAAYDEAARWRDAGRCVISGFHSPVEKECLRILLRGRQPVIICLARGLDGMRLPAEWKKMLAEGRLLVLSQFSTAERRITMHLAAQRNKFVAALADEVVFAHVTPRGQLQELMTLAMSWHVPCGVLADPTHFPPVSTISGGSP